MAEGTVLTGAVVAIVVAFVGYILRWAWSHTHTRIDGKADATSFAKLEKKIEEHMILRREFEEHVRSDEHQLEAIRSEQATQRATIAKIFDQMRDMATQNADNHVELLGAIHDAVEKARGGK